MPWAPVRHATPLAVCLRRFADHPAVLPVTVPPGWSRRGAGTAPVRLR
jgi:hypothetical protein